MAVLLLLQFSFTVLLRTFTGELEFWTRFKSNGWQGNLCDSKRVQACIRSIQNEEVASGLVVRADSIR